MTFTLSRFIGSLGIIAIAAAAAAAVAQERGDADRIGALVEGAWHVRLETGERSSRYLEILGLRPVQAGRFEADALFGWADGPISPVAAGIAAEGTAAILTLRAGTGAALTVRFDPATARGSYAMPGQTPRAASLSRLTDSAPHASLAGVWRARRNNETRVFDIKRVLGTLDGATIAVGQYGFVERPDDVRQMVATVTGSPAKAELAWTTGSSTARLQRTSTTSLTGTFERRDGGAARADPIVFRTAPLPGPAKEKTVTGSDPGQKFPNYPLVAMDGRPVQIRDFAGKIVLVNLFQPWCIWCIDEMSAFRAAKARYGDRLVIVPVLYGVTDPQQLQQSARVKRYGVDIYGGGKPPVSFKGIPSSWILDRNGVIVERIKYMKPHELFGLLDRIVAG